MSQSCYSDPVSTFDPVKNYPKLGNVITRCSFDGMKQASPAWGLSDFLGGVYLYLTSVYYEFGYFTTLRLPYVTVASFISAY